MRLMNRLLGKTFWSTVIRSALFFPILTVVMLPLTLQFGSAEEVAEIKRLGVPYLAMSLISGALFGSWVGWGLAYWRYQNRPLKRGVFSLYPLATGLIVFPWMMWTLLDEAPMSITADERLAAMIFATVVGPPMALLMATFWRYAPQFTALRK